MNKVKESYTSHSNASRNTIAADVPSRQGT